MALRGYDEIFSKHKRHWLIELSYCDDKARRADLARKTAEDTADKWHEVHDNENLDSDSDAAQLVRASVLP